MDIVIKNLKELKELVEEMDDNTILSVTIEESVEDNNGER
jgi:hypothetical protein